MRLMDYATGIQHLGLPTKDLAKTVDFYTGLGFETALDIGNPERGTRVVFLRFQNLTIETYETSAAAGCTGAIAHVAVDVKDVEAAFEAAKAGGYKLLDSEIRSLPFWENGVRFFNIKGPNAEIIEFSQIL